MALACAATPVVAQPAGPPIYALVVGVDEYKNLRTLAGAANDANDVAAALRARGARETVVLLNGQATRAAIMQRFADLAAKAARDKGWVVFHYAGHGGQEPERIPGDEVDGKDEAFLLGGYANSGAGTAERLVDNDIFAMLSAVPKSVPILMIADSCHSGTMTRSVDRRVTLGTRNAVYGPIVGDALPPPAATTKSRKYEELPNVVFVASATDDEVTVELKLEGQARGAVSWHMAKAIGGAADLNNDGTTTLGELRQYIGTSARITTENRQHPTVNYLSGRDSDPLPFGQRGSGGGATILPKLGVAVLGGPTSLVADIPGAVLASSQAAADLIWDVAKGQVVSSTLGDMVATQAPDQAQTAFIAGVVDKWRALKGLRALADSRPLDVEIGPRGAGARYSSGEVSIAVADRKDPRLKYVTMINLAGDGTVQWLYPNGAAEEAALASTVRPGFATRVMPPYGADHVIAIATEDDPARLRDALRAVNGRQASTQAYNLIADTLRGRTCAIGMAGLYTGTDNR